MYNSNYSKYCDAQLGCPDVVEVSILIQVIKKCFISLNNDNCEITINLLEYMYYVSKNY